MKMLSIGNSYSQDAHKWLAPLAAAYGDEVTAVSIYLAGCSLENHWKRYTENADDYDHVVNGDFIGKGTFTQIMQTDDWDVITLQQVSQICGDLSTYQPYLTYLYDMLHEAFPNSKILIHKTWAYETDSTHPGFVNYDCDQKKMYAQLDAAYEQVAKDMHCPLIPAGDAIQYIRENCPEFDYANGGRSLCRDGFHLDKIYGRYAAALVWYAVLFNKDISQLRFIPEGADEALLQTVHNAVLTVLGKS